MSGNGFFDLREKLVAPRKPRGGSGTGSEAALSVTQVTKVIEKAITGGVPPSLVVRGEVSNFNLNRGSGHAYFTLKDPGACINCVMFRSEFERVKFKPGDGMELLATGGVRIYAAQGKYQLYVNQLQPIGQGALELAFQQLRSKLEAEGLFDVERKREVPRYPAKIVIITSRETAALQDMLKVLRRFAWLQLQLYHVPVQGDGCGRQIAAAIEHVNEYSDQIGGPDLILLGRGGGALEDLWGFNEESLARAIAASRIPIITGIGHEVDVSIADLVADHHAHTPTEAAQIATGHWRNAVEVVEGIAVRLRREMRSTVQDCRRRLVAAERHEVFRRPTDWINDLRILLDDRQRSMQMGMNDLLRDQERRLQECADRLEKHTPAMQVVRFATKIGEIQGRLGRGMLNALQRRGDRIQSMSALLDAVSPHRVLQRGYSLTRLKKSGAIVVSAAQVKEGDRMVTSFTDGEVESVVEDGKQRRLFD